MLRGFVACGHQADTSCTSSPVEVSRTRPETTAKQKKVLSSAVEFSTACFEVTFKAGLR